MGEWRVRAAVPRAIAGTAGTVSNTPNTADPEPLINAIVAS